MSGFMTVGEAEATERVHLEAISGANVAIWSQSESASAMARPAPDMPAAACQRAGGDSTMRRTLGGPSMHYGHTIATAASALALAAPLPAAAPAQAPPRSATPHKLVDFRSLGTPADLPAL